MTVKNLLENQIEELSTKSNSIKAEINSYLKDSENTDSLLDFFGNFTDRFHDTVYNFCEDYSRSFPKILESSIYRKVAEYNSTAICIDLKSYYKTACQEILDKLPPIDDSLEIQE